MHLYRSRGISKIKVKNTEGVVQEISLEDLTLAGFDVDSNNEVKNPVPTPYFSSFPQPYAHPGVVYKWIVKGAFFDKNTVIGISGVTIHLQKFVSDNEIYIEFTPDLVGYQSITINNGVSATFTDRLEVFSGSLYYVDNSNIISSNGINAVDGTLIATAENVSVDICEFPVGVKKLYLVDINVQGVYSYAYGHIKLRKLTGEVIFEVQNVLGNGSSVVLVNGVEVVRNYTGGSRGLEFGRDVDNVILDNTSDQLTRRTEWPVLPNETLILSHERTIKPQYDLLDARIKTWN